MVSNQRTLTPEVLASGVRAGDRTLLGRAITLIESNAPHHQADAQSLLKLLLPDTGNSIRLGITGVPGAGKSTLIEALGQYVIDKGHRVAVLAVDPSSSLTRGSILGDKTRMQTLSTNDNAFIRPSPSGGTLGGVARKTRESMLLFEAAGYDVIIVETIGVGQSEITVRSLVDFFLLIQLAGAGDELQGIKRGVMELADCIAVNKADGDNEQRAKTAAADLERAVHYLQPATEGWTTKVMTVSALAGVNIEMAWSTVEEFVAIAKTNGAFETRRRSQQTEWLHAMIRERLAERFYSDPRVAAHLNEIEHDVANGQLPVTEAAMKLLGYTETD